MVIEVVGGGASTFANLFPLGENVIQNKSEKSEKRWKN